MSRRTAQLAGYTRDVELLGDYDEEYLGFSFKSIAKAVKKVASPIQKAATAVGHAAGAAVTSKIGQGILGTALAVTGVGAPAAAGIFAATKGAGNLIKKGGNLKHALTGAAQGAVEGVASVAAGRVVRGAKNAITSKLAKRGATAVVKHASGGAGAVADSPAIIDQILERGVPAIADPVGPDYSPIPDVQAAALPVDNSAQIAAANAAAAQQQQAAQQAAQARADAQAAVDQANQQAAQARADAQAAIDQANQAARDAATQAAQAKSQAAIDAANAAAQAASDAAQAKIAAANQASADAAAAQAQQPTQRRSESSAANLPSGGGGDSSGDDFATQQANEEAAAQAAAAQEAAAQEAAVKKAKTTKTLIIAGGVLAGVAGVAIVAKRHKRKGGRR